MPESEGVQQDESFEEENPTFNHTVPIAEYLSEVNQKNKKSENHTKHGSSLRLPVICHTCMWP